MMNILKKELRITDIRYYKDEYCSRHRNIGAHVF